ncbi:unnamed protein product [Lathyrus oleraceus]
MSQKTSFYPQVESTNPDANSPFSHSSSSSSMYPSITTDNLSPEYPKPAQQQQQQQPSEHVLVTVPDVILHLIEKDSSVHLASGDLTIVSLKEGNNVAAVIARIGDQIQWPLAKDVSTVKLDEDHYFFTLKVPQSNSKEDIESEVLNYGMTVATKGQEKGLVLKELDKVLEKYSFLSVEKVKGVKGWEVLEKKEVLEESSAAAYWTTLAPNVEDYNGRFARWIAAGSGQMIRGILFCGDVTVERLKWGNDFMKKRLQPGSSQSQISPHAMASMKRVKKLTKMSEKVALGVLSGVVKVSGFFTSSVVNSKPGKKLFSLLPGEIVLATLDGFNKVCDAAEVAGRNVMSTSSVVTTGLVSHKYGEQAGEVTNEGFGAAGHAIGTALAVFKLRKACNPKSVIKPTTMAKAAAQASSTQLKAKK